MRIRHLTGVLPIILVLRFTGVPAGYAQTPSCEPASSPDSGASATLREQLAELEGAYERVAGAIQEGQPDTALANELKNRACSLGLPAGQPTKRSEYAMRWRTVHSALRANADSLAALLRQTTDHPPRRTRNTDLPAERIDQSTPLVSAVAARVFTELQPSLSALDSLSGIAIDQGIRLARFTRFSHLYNAFRFHRDRLQAIADEACSERDPLCDLIDPTRRGAYRGVSVAGFPQGFYGVGYFTSLSPVLPLVKGYRTVGGAQLVMNLPAFDEPGLELSLGSVFGDFVLMPGVLVSPRSSRTVGMSGSVIYLARNRISLGATYSPDRGLGIRVTRGWAPKTPRERPRT